VARQATRSKSRPAQRSNATPSKINKSPKKIIKSAVRKPESAERILAARSAKAAQSRPVEVEATGTALRRAGVAATATLPAVGTAEGRVSVLAGEASVSPVEVSVPLLNLPTVTLPPVELPAMSLPRTDLPPVILPPVHTPSVTLPPTDPLTEIPPGSRPSAAAPLPQADARAAQVEGTASARTEEETARTTRGIQAGAGTTVLSALTVSTPSMQAGAILSIGPPVAAIIDQLGQGFRTAKVPDAGGSTAIALVLAAAIGAAATGTAGSGSAGASGLAVLSTALRLPALGGSRRLRGRLRESAFRRPRLPGFSPD